MVRRRLTVAAPSTPPEGDDKPAKPAARALNRLELADLARAMMPEALKKLETILYESGSDLAVLQAYRALKDTAYGKDPHEISPAIEFESLTDDELKAAFKSELTALNATDGCHAGGVAKAPPAGESDRLVQLLPCSGGLVSTKTS